MRIVIAEDDLLLRECLALLLRAEGIDVVATAPDAVGFLAAIEEHKPDVAIVDVRMPPTHTDEDIVAAVEARRRRPGLAVLVLSAYVEQALRHRRRRAQAHPQHLRQAGAGADRPGRPARDRRPALPRGRRPPRLTGSAET